MEHGKTIRQLSTPLDPVPTGETPFLPRFDTIDSVVFDIYGTLVISGAGDISLAEEFTSETAMRSALESAGISADEESVLAASDTYHQLIRQQQDKRKGEGIDFPEIDIRDVWRELFAAMGINTLDENRIEEIAVRYECAVNPVWPMPGLSETLATIRERGLRMGIVSNAQFYTPWMFPAFLGHTLEELGFDPELMIFSFEHRIGKPSRSLYAELVKRGLNPNTSLYVGNDRLKDVWPSGLEGFRTVLFAGDERSLRWRHDDERLSNVEPGAVVTELPQILSLLP